MPLRTYIADGYQVCTGDLALDREFVLLGVRQGIVIEICRELPIVPKAPKKCAKVS